MATVTLRWKLSGAPVPVLLGDCVAQILGGPLTVPLSKAVAPGALEVTFEDVPPDDGSAEDPPYTARLQAFDEHDNPVGTALEAMFSVTSPVSTPTPGELVVEVT